MVKECWKNSSSVGPANIECSIVGSIARLLLDVVIIGH